VRVIGGEIPPNAQSGLDRHAVQQGVVLACQARPTSDLIVADPADATESTFDSQLLARRELAPGIFELTLTTPPGYSYLAGQFARLYKDDSTARPYSFASAPRADNNLVFHVQALPAGTVSQWLTHTISVGTVVRLGAPQGNAVYLPEASTQPLLLIGTGTGLAPLLAVAQAARDNNHQAPIVLYHGGRDEGALYAHDALTSLESAWREFRYCPCVSGDLPIRSGARHGRASDLALQDYPSLSGWQVYLCGNPDMVNTTKFSVFLAGASMSQIHADPFVASA
jgi:NAD(P)H-flavin reductase